MPPAEVQDRLDLNVETKKSDEERDQTLWQVCKALTPGWENVPFADIRVHLVKGGITNLLFKVSCPLGVVLVRVYGDKTELVINREKETAILRQLSASGFSVPYHGSFGNGRIEGWQEMRALEPAEMMSTSPVDYPDMIAEQLQRMHVLKVSEPGNPDGLPQLFVTIDHFARGALEINFDDNETRKALFKRMNIPLMVEELRWLETVLPSARNHYGADLVAKMAEPAASAARFMFASVFCHNDMLCGNILVDKENHCQLIDFEYGSYSFRGFDIANHFVEYAGFDADWGKWHPTPAQMTHFLKSYVKYSIKSGALAAFPNPSAEDAFIAELLRWVCIFCLASHLFWGFWCITQARYSPIDFDFLTYGHSRFVGYFYKKGLYSRHIFNH